MDEPQSADWRVYPFELVPGDPQLSFPAAEANHPDCESDTWFLAAELTGDSGRRYAFLTIFNKNRPAQSIVADFYTFALFDLDAGTYGTYTDYDMPPTNMQPDTSPKMSLADDRLEITYDSDAGTSVWRPCRDEGNRLVPYTYDVVLVGTDRTGDTMRVDLHVTPSRAPVPLGAAAYNGKIECFGQADTYSYFQTGMAMTGTLSWGSVEESVTGTAGHVDRQWFPLIANGGGTDGDVRARSHEWRTINLDNGVDLSVTADDECVEVRIADRGPGLSVEQLESAGTPFLRWVGVEQDDQRRAGLGLGLYITRALAEREGGSLRLTARDGGGLVATLSLPIAR